MEKISERMGNKIFALEVNLTILDNRFIYDEKNLNIIKSMQRSLEQLKEIKKELENGEQS